MGDPVDPLFGAGKVHTGDPGRLADSSGDRCVWGGPSGKPTCVNPHCRIHGRRPGAVPTTPRGIVRTARERALEQAVRLILALDATHQPIDSMERVTLAPKTREQLEAALRGDDS